MSRSDGQSKVFDIAYRDCDLSYHSIAAHVGQGPMTVSKIWNRWFQDGNTERRLGSQRSPITNSGEDRHAPRMFLMDRAATSRALGQELGSFARQQMSVLKVRRRLQEHTLN
ncbi:HTH_Tnp_Tc3_2 domain-containing protein [Trichonephila clavipes]|nr:HTH_Tnp_Tc3_2 domain-containing protein [Trichonephila clavipes]